MSNYEDVLEHYGMPRRSGRYPWGSGENPYQRTGLFKGWVKDQKAAGISAKDIAQIAKDAGCDNTVILRSLKDAKFSPAEIMTAMDINSSRYRAIDAIGSEDEKAERNALIRQYITADQMSDSAIGRAMNLNESTIRSIRKKLDDDEKKGISQTAEVLKESLANSEYGMVDVGKGSELYIGVSQTRMTNALAILKEQGYVVQTHKVNQPFSGNQTTLHILTKEDKEWKDVKNNLDKLTPLGQFYCEDGSNGIKKVEPPASLDSKRVGVRYKEDGGADKDGVIEIRRGVKDLSLGNSAYAQVRIKVDGTHYIKGVAVYSDDLPKGVDVLVNSNKKRGTPLMSDDPEAKQVLKPLKDLNPKSTDPFGAALKAQGQSTYIDKNGKEVLSPINKLNEEGDWGAWGKSLSSQFLSKQPVSLAKQQLNLAYEDSLKEYEDIMSIPSATVRKKLLEDFAGGCETNASDLSAAKMPRQRIQVLLPMTTLKDDEIYAPNYNDGEKVVLIRYPHSGKFEIPELTVNNRNEEGRKIYGAQAKDMVGVKPIVAAQLSGADFDGDTVMVIPNNDGRIKTEKMIKELAEFDNKASFPYHEGMKVMTKREKGIQMGSVTNLIADMTAQGAPQDEVIRAVKHSMVVIDAEKHKLDYKTSEKVFNIKELKEKYQSNINPKTGKTNHGAGTIMTRAGAEVHIKDRRLKYVSEMTPDELKRYKNGELIWKETGKQYSSKDAKGNWVKKDKMIEVSRMDTVSDAHQLVSDKKWPIELAYADYANKMKSLAQRARKEAIATENTPYSAAAAKVYSNEVQELKNMAARNKMNAPRERMAIIYTDLKTKQAKENNPELYYDKDKFKKMKSRYLAEGRALYSARRETKPLTDRQWEAINAGAVSPTLFSEVISGIDSKSLKEMAMPKKQAISLTPNERKQIQSLANRTRANGTKAYTTAEIAQKFGVSASTVSSILSEG